MARLTLSQRVARRSRRWLAPVLRPFPGRRLRPALRPENVGRLAAACKGGVRGPAFSLLLQRIDQSRVLPSHRVKVFVAGQAAFEAMIADIDGAAGEVLLESYILRDDATGRRFQEALARAARRGVRVKVAADSIGSVSTREGFWQELRTQGVDARLLRRLFAHPFSPAFRNHRKILVVDRRVGFTGGMNIGEEYGSFRGAEGDTWRDTHVRIEGPAAWEMALVFNEGWTAAGGDPLDIPPLELDDRCDDARILVVDSQPRRGLPEKAAVFAALIAAAKSSILVSNAYFAPRRLAIETLVAAANRGVEVRLLLPGKTDVALVRHAGHGHFQRLLAAGVHIHEYQAAILHAKTVVVDGYAAVVGSTNLDFRSFHFNAECNLVILDEPTGTQLEAVFRDDLTRAKEITPAIWARRSLAHRVGDRLARLLSPVL
jgi:cardiolipin synthase A/B